MNIKHRCQRGCLTMSQLPSQVSTSVFSWDYSQQQREEKLAQQPGRGSPDPFPHGILFSGGIWGQLLVPISLQLLVCSVYSSKQTEGTAECEARVLRTHWSKQYNLPGCERFWILNSRGKDLACKWLWTLSIGCRKSQMPWALEFLGGLDHSCSCGTTAIYTFMQIYSTMKFRRELGSHLNTEFWIFWLWKFITYGWFPRYLNDKPVNRPQNS